MTIFLTVTERPLSPTEQIIWLADAACSLNFTMHFELQGRLTEENLKVALLQVQHRHPLLRMRMVEEGMKVWFRTGGVGPIPIRLVEGPTERLSEEAEHEVRTHLNWRQGPLARCVWIRHSPDHGTLLLTFNHVIGDGISGSFLVRDLLRALANERLSVLPLAESLDGHLPARARGVKGFFGYLWMLAHMLGWILRKGRPRIIPAQAGVGERHANLVFMQFEPPFTEALTARARAAGTTVHGALAAAIVLAGFPEINAPRVHALFFSPLNMRDRFEPPIGEDLGFYVAAALSSHKVNGHTDFWCLARELKQGITAAVDMGLPFYGLTGLAPGLMFLYRLAGGGSKGMRAAIYGLTAAIPDTFALTNIGRVKVEPRYGPFQVSALGFVASLSGMGSSAFTAASLNNTLCLNFIAMAPLISRATQLRVAARTRAILESAVATPSTPSARGF